MHSLSPDALKQCITALSMPVSVLRKSRAVGIYPPKGIKLAREQLEETVLVVQRILELSPAGQLLPFCAFNGGNDVFVDIGDKSWGVMACQRYFGGIDGGKSLHVGDQFLSAGANDFKVWRARSGSTICTVLVLIKSELGTSGMHHCVDRKSWRDGRFAGRDSAAFCGERSKS